MILLEDERKTILDALLYMLKSAYTDAEIRTACANDPKVYKQILIKKREKIRRLIKCIYIFKN
jgi:hypothetical protein